MSIEQVALALWHVYGGQIFLTASEKGICVCDEKKKPYIVQQQYHLTNGADTSGCGDTVIAVASAALLSGASQKQAAQLANAAAAVVIGQRGPYAPTRAQILEKLRW